jgi:hypothetical protein
MAVANAPAFAFDCGGDDPAVIATNLQALAFELRCNFEPGDEDYDSNNLGNWDKNNPIWEKRRQGDCGIHDRLAGKLHEVRVFEDDGDCKVRPRKNCDDRPPENQNNQIQGASGDVANGKYEGAVSKLDSFINDAYKARLNSSFVDIMGTNATYWRNFFVTEADEARACIARLIP